MDFALMKLSACRVGASCAVVTAMLLTSGAAVADERSDLTDRIMKTDATPCTNESYSLFKQSMTAMVMHLMIDSTALGLTSNWKPGNPDYESLKELLVAGIAEDEAGPAPLFRYKSGTELIRSRFDGMPAADLRYAEKFFGAPNGRSSWRYLVDGQNCTILIQSSKRLQQSQHAPSPSLLAMPGAYEAQLKKDFERLTPAQAAKFTQDAKRIVEAMPYPDFVDADTLKARIQEIVAKHADQIPAITKAYKPVP